MDIKKTYNNHIGEVLNEIAKSYIEEVEYKKVNIAIDNEDDEVLIAHIHSIMKNYFPMNEHDNLMDYIIEQFASKVMITEYKNVLNSLVEILV